MCANGSPMDDAGVTLTEPPHGGYMGLNVIGCAGLPTAVLTADYRLTPSIRAITCTCAELCQNVLD
jgi:hypothetical protein